MTARKLRDPRGWNAGLLKALALPDGAFKLYVWLRLNARIHTGCLETTQVELALALKKARGTIRANLKMLEQAGVCRMEFPHNPHGRGRIQITDDYWPYERTECATDNPELKSYLDHIQKIVGDRACIRTPLSPADEFRAAEWLARGVTIEHIRHAVWIGCARKYVSWRNGAPRVPIGSLAYFEPILEEVKGQNAPAEYWDYTRFRIERMEKLWLNGKGSDQHPRDGEVTKQGVPR